jgi:HD-GYP domain-containing protein (c-di-GMP phosphodiesterase class II)
LEGEDFISYCGLPLVAKQQLRGVLEVFDRTARQRDPEWLDFLETLAGQAAIAIENSILLENLQRTNQELVLAYDRTLEGWARALELRDKETEGHTRRVADLTVKMGIALGMNPDELVQVRRGALLHDIGKLGIPDKILLKEGPLAEEEWRIMRLHPTYARSLIEPIPYLRPTLDIPYSHHEHWDGSGYPQGLAGEQIPLAARIFTVIDVWDALTSNRVYRASWTAEQARTYLHQNAGVLFDPHIVEAFFRIRENQSGEGAG